MVTAKSMKKVPIKWAENGALFLEMVGWGGLLDGIKNQLGGFDKKCLVTLAVNNANAPS